MSSIDNLSSVGGETSSLLRRIPRQGNGAGTADEIGTGPPNDSRRAEFVAKLEEAALAAGLDPAAADGLQDEIAAAISQAINNSDGATDRRQVTRDAIDNVLQSHGVDLDKFKSRFQPATQGSGSQPPPPAPPDGSGHADFESKFQEAALAAGLDTEAADKFQDAIKAAIDEVLSNADATIDPMASVQDAVDGVLEEYGVDLATFRSHLQSLTGGVQFVDAQA